jgi:putative PIN family toxin of toxin-antitoxin system
LRCVFDTNVLVSALLLPDSKPRHALELALQEGRILLSFAALAELYEVLSRKRFRRYVDEEDIRSFLAALTREAEWVDVDVQIQVAVSLRANDVGAAHRLFVLLSRSSSRRCFSCQ